MRTLAVTHNKDVKLLPPPADHPRKEAAAPRPEDRVTLEKGEDSHGWLYTITRGMAQVAGGFAGAVGGAAFGGVRHAGSGKTSLPEDVHSASRVIGAATGLAMGVTAGLAHGPLGLVVGLVAGPILGAAVGGALPAAFEAGVDALRGAVVEGRAGIKKGAAKGAAVVDWLADRFSRKKPEEPPQTASPADRASA